MVEQAKLFDDNKREKLGVNYYSHQHRTPLCPVCKTSILRETMAGQATSWADQWGPGGMGAMEDDLGSNAKKEDKGKKAKGGFTKAKEAAFLGAHKLRSGTLNGINWIKKQKQKQSQSQKKNSSTNK